MGDAFADTKVIHTLPWNSEAITSVAFIGNDKIAAGNKRGDILIWNLPALGGKSPDPVRRLAGHDNEINRILATPDGKTLISAGSDRTVKYWDAVSDQGEPGKVVLNDGVGRVGVSEKVSKLSDLPRPVTASVVVQKPLRELTAHKDWIWGLALSRDGKTLVSGDDSSVVIVSEVSTGKELRRWKVKQWVRALDLSPDGKTVVTAEHFPQTKAVDTDFGVRFWDADTGELKFDTGKEFKGGMSAVRFSHDGKQLAVCQGNIDREGPVGKVYLLDPDTGKKIREFAPGHDRGATDLAFHPDGQHLFSSGRDRVVKAWRLADGTHLRDLGQGGKGLTESIYSLSLSPNGKLLAAADGVGQVVIHLLSQ